MGDLLSNRWIQLGAASIIAVVIGGLIGTSLLSSEGGATGGDGVSATPREFVLLTTGPSLLGRGEPGSEQVSLELANLLNQPLTAAAAVAAGWTDPGQCSAGQGRYFTKGAAGEGEPFVLMYNKSDDLIGIYHFNLSELPAPFTKKAGLTEAGLSADHWGLFVYFVDPTNAC